MSLKTLNAFYAHRRSPWRMAGYLAAPLVYWPTQSVIAALAAAFVAVKIIDYMVERRIHYRIRLHGLDDFAERPPRLDRGHNAIVTGLAFSPSGDRLASCAFEGSVRVWDLAAGRTIREFALLRNDARGIVFSPDGGRLLICGEGEFIVQDIIGEKTLMMIDAPPGESFAQACYSPDGRRILTVGPLSHSRDAVRHMDIRDAETGAVLSTLSGFGLYALASDGSVLAGEPVDGERDEVRLWRCDDGREIARVRLPQRFWREAPGATAFRSRMLYLAPEGRFLGVTDAYGEHCHIDVGTGEVLRRFKIAEVELPNAIALVRGARTLVMSRGSGGQSQGVCVFDAETGALRGSIETARSDWGLPFAISADERLIAIAGEDQPAPGAGR